MINWSELSIFLLVFLVVTVIGFLAIRWRPGDLNRLQEWGLAGRRFGSIVSWFLVGGDTYTAYTFLAVPALIYAQGALGFYAVPFATLANIFLFMAMSRLWTISRHRGYVTTADFVRERFDSKLLALAVAVTGILATMPYIALQVYGMQLCLSLMGVPTEISLFIAFGILAAYTYISGLRGSALISIFKDICIWIVVLVTLISVTTRVGGMEHIFAAIPTKKLLLTPQQYSAYATLAFGSALALFLYPHAFTAVLSSNSRIVVKRVAIFLPIYTLMLGLIALIGYIAVAVGIHPSATYQTNIAFPEVLTTLFPPQFAGFGLAAISIGALVPSGIMSIAAANLFSRNIYREYINPDCTELQEANIAKVASLVVKIGGLAFIIFFPTTLSINLQLLSTIWILQTLPAVFLGLYTNWFHRWSLLIGWFFGMVVGTWSIVALHFQSSVYPYSLFGFHFPMHAAVAGLIVNLAVSSLLTLLFRNLDVAAGEDSTLAEDYEPQHIAANSQPTLATTPTASNAAASVPLFSNNGKVLATPMPPSSQSFAPRTGTLAQSQSSTRGTSGFTQMAQSSSPQVTPTPPASWPSSIRPPERTPLVEPSVTPRPASSPTINSGTQSGPRSLRPVPRRPNSEQ